LTKQADIIRLELAIDNKGPAVQNETVVAGGFAERPDKDVFVIGPTGLVLDPQGTLYVSDAIGNGINAIPNALTRKDSAGTGILITKDGMLRRPLAMTLAPNGNLLVVNGLNGQVIEVSPGARKQIASRWINSNKAQTPPGSGDLFGVALTPDGKGIYFVNDDVNQLAIAH
jgi:DNA-binding beta-propeller fold protein YncE